MKGRKNKVCNRQMELFDFIFSWLVFLNVNNDSRGSEGHRGGRVLQISKMAEF